MSFRVRDGRPDDLSFVYDSWMKAYRQSPVVSRVPKRIYDKNQKRVIENCLKKGRLAVLCNPDDASHIFGYCVSELMPDAFVYHWMFVKYPFRHFGLARFMLELLAFDAPHDVPLFASHIPYPGYFEHVSKKYQITYDPSKKEHYDSPRLVAESA